MDRRNSGSTVTALAHHIFASAEPRIIEFRSLLANAIWKYRLTAKMMCQLVVS